MARRRGLAHIEKSSYASALNLARQHVMGVSPFSSFEEPSAVLLGTLEKRGNSGPRGVMEIEGIRVSKIAMTIKGNGVLPPPMETNNVIFALILYRHQLLFSWLTASRAQPRH
ncbi:hypothetical protein TNCV_4692371 [Trichonephila clavipes]|nr:hypothetical protein TNCV_4692371 [Trichonephila clavipes]